jgi:serine/threonine-protein kinase
LYAVPFNPDKLSIEGNAVPVLEGVSTDVAYGFSQLDFARNGTLLYRQGPLYGGLWKIEWLDRIGNATPFLEAASFFIPRLAPDGSSRLAVVETQGSMSDIVVYDWEQKGSRNKLTSGLRGNSFPVWTPDGKYIFFQSADGIFWARTDGTGKDIFLPSQVGQSPTSFTRDGKLLVFFERNSAGGALIKVVAVQYDSGHPQAAGEPKILLQTPSTTPHPAFSPDGKWLAYAFSEDGLYQVYVCDYQDTNRRWQISIAGGHMPVWSRPPRKELFYRGDDSRIMVATYTVEGDQFIPNPAIAFSDRRVGNTGLTPGFDVSPDGSRLAVLIQPEDAQFEKTRSHMTLVLNFFDEVRRRVATRTP